VEANTAIPDTDRADRVSDSTSGHFRCLENAQLSKEGGDLDGRGGYDVGAACEYDARGATELVWTP